MRQRDRRQRISPWLILGAVFVVGTVSSGHAAAADKGEIKAAIARAADYLRTNIKGFRSDKRVLAAYALYKAGDSETSPAVAEVLNEIVGKFPEGKYTPNAGNASMYEGGVTAMFLAEVDPVKYRPQLQMIADYLIENQLENGGWDYRSPAGDTSLTQYGCLGLWAAVRSGIDVPQEVWDKVLIWHFQNQLPDGGYPYVPGSTSGPGGGASTLNMSGAAVGSMTIAAMHLFPREAQSAFGFSSPKVAQTVENEPGRKFGLLERQEPVDEESENAGQAVAAAPSKPRGPYQVQSNFGLFKQSAGRTLAWVQGHFEVENQVGPKMYYYYTIERMAALASLEQIGGQDWFAVCSEFLLQRQEADGSWTLDVHDDRTSYPVGTSFGILFLAQSTAKLLNRLPQRSPLGGGLLAGGRGLPDDLSQVEVDQGDVTARQPTGPLDQLLKDLSRTGGEDLFQVQEKIIEKIQLGDRSELIGQTDQLVKLLDYPDPQIRRIAMWAIGRSDDLKLVKHAIQAILEDPDTDVLIEAHAALCWFSRRPDGFGLPDNPVADLSPDVSDVDRHAAIDKWRRQAVKAWGQWYLRICPYAERDDPFLIRLKRRVNARS